MRMGAQDSSMLDDIYEDNNPEHRTMASVIEDSVFGYFLEY